MAFATAPLSASGVLLEPCAHGDSITSAAALAVVPAASNSLAAAFPISLPTFIGIALRAAALAALAALISDCPCRLTTRAATSPFSVLRRHSIRGSGHEPRPALAVISHSAYGLCTGWPLPGRCPCHSALASRLFREHCASPHRDRLVETVSSVCGTSFLCVDFYFEAQRTGTTLAHPHNQTKHTVPTLASQPDTHSNHQPRPAGEVK